MPSRRVKGAKGKGKEPGTVIVGVGCVGPADTIALAHEAKAAGADGVLVLPPYFVKLSDDEIFAHYKAVNEAVKLPIMVYNIPGNAVNAVTPALADRLADLDNVVAIKESSGDWNNFYATMIAVKDRLRVFLRSVLRLRRAGRQPRRGRHRRLLPERLSGQAASISITPPRPERRRRPRSSRRRAGA